ncbi:hypothetical protein JKP88DRAFT_290692 [Tribonema minus]|uniref:Uncharacterized protein n=1 Tax=Tribonema minus TaxID=303371 RepID=A0A835YWL1_9STRA|nr:hypothetical protein JKP88DRAFT_290692 [Tribonema minus]
MRAASRGMNASRQQWMSYLASAASGSRNGAIAGVAEEAGVYVALREMQSYRDAHPGAYDRAAFLTQRIMTLVDIFKRKRDRGGDGVREIALMTRTAMRADVLWRALAKRVRDAGDLTGLEVVTLAARDLHSFGDARSRDVFNRNIYQAARAADATSAVSVTHSLHGITAATGSAKGDSLPFEMVKLNAVETAADSFAGRLDVLINDGTDASAGVKVAELSSANAKFVAATMSADFGSSYSAAFTKGVGQDGSTTATVQTLSTGGSGTAVQLNATSDRLFVKAANTDLRLRHALKYNYAHGDGLAGSSTGVLQLNLDPLNLLDNAMGTGSFEFNSYTDAGVAQPVLTLGAGAAAGAQTVNFSNANIGVGIAASTTYN